MDRNPFRRLEQQFERLQRQFEDALDLWDGEEFEAPLTDLTTSRMGIDLADCGDEFVLTADVPGFERDDIDLRLADDRLHITAEREHEEREEEDEFYIRSERSHRTARRSVRLPEPVDEDAVEATYKNGVLTVTLPKREPNEVEGTSIDVE